jgi:SAM-dependent methyltransferase
MNKVNKLVVYTKKHGIIGTLKRILKKTLPKRKKKLSKLPNYKSYMKLFDNLEGVEIGGTSIFFQDRLPLYKVVKSLDCVNFGTKTIWQGTLKEGYNFHYYKNKTGYQHICDSVNMDIIPSKKYDFCLSSNVLEHIANPFKAISEWLRVLSDDGLLLVIVPRKDGNFDHNRPITSFEHLKSDCDNNVGEDDLGHLEEILQLHDLSLGFPPDETPAEFKARSIINFQNRALHQHVFDMELLQRIFDYFNLEVLENVSIKTDYIILGRRRTDQLKQINTDQGKN